MITQPIFSRRFVGRHAELEFLIGAAQAVKDGPMRSIVITGEAGTGKTRLIREFRTSAGIKPMRTVMGRCFDYAQASYAPIEELLRSLHEAEPKVLDRDEQLAETMQTFFAHQRTVAVADATDYRKRKALDAIVELFRRYSAIQPTAFVIEDLHWSDSATLDVLQHVAATFSGNGALFIVSARHDDPETKYKMEAFLAKFARQPLLSRVRLEGLNEAASLEMIESALLENDTVPLAQRRKIATAAGGNPLYIEELLKSTVDGASDDMIPSNVHLAVESRLAALSGADLHVLRVAAILVRFSPAFLAEVTHESPETIFDALRKALALNLLRESRVSGTYAFRHEVLRQVVLSSLLPDQEKLLHRAVAEQLEHFPNADEYVEELALHWWQSGDIARSQKYNKEAGDRAFQKFAFEDAITYYERAAQSREDDREAGNLQRLLATAYMRTSRSTANVECLRRALEFYEKCGALDEKIEVLVQLSRAHYRKLEFAESHTALQSALSAIQSVENTALRVSVYTWQAWYCANRDEEPEAAMQATALAEPFLGDVSAQQRAEFYEALSAAQWLLGDFEAWRAAASRAVSEAKTSGDPFVIVHQLSVFANQSIAINAAQAKALSSEALEVATAASISEIVPHALATLAFAHLTAGDLPLAARDARQVLATADDFPFARVICAIVAVSAALELEDKELLADALDPSYLDLAKQNAALHLQLMLAHAEVEMAGGNRERALATLKEIVQPLKSALYHEQALVLVAKWGVRERLPHAEKLLVAAEKRGPHIAPMLALFRAYATSGPSRVTHAGEALAAFHAMGWRLREAECLELLDDKVAAAALFTQCGATRSAARLGSGRDDPSQARFALTPREAEIATLVAEGKTNRTIAQELVLSDRTIENHLTSIFSKLGVKSRTELAAQWKR